MINENLDQATVYEFPRLYLMKMPRNQSEFVLKYTFREDENQEPPDEAPPARGPYASLKVGQPQRAEEILEYAMVRVRGWAVNEISGAAPIQVVAVTQSGSEIARATMVERPDVASFFKIPHLGRSGFELSLPISVLQEGNIQLNAKFKDRISPIGVVSADKELIPRGPQIAKAAQQPVQSGFSAWLDAPRDSIVAYAPDGRRDYGFRFDALALLVEAFSALVFFSLLWVVLKSLGLNFLVSVGLGLAGWITIYGLGWLAPPILGIKFLIPFMVLATALIALMRWIRSRPTIIYLPLAVVLAQYEVFDHLRRFHFSQGTRWWGRLLYFWRDSDWYATRGFARAIFTEGSLQGGHAVFWFQAGPRYWAFITQVLLGEQDVLIGILMVTAGFFAVFFLASRFLLSHSNGSSVALGWLLIVVGLVFFADDMFVGFGFVGSSEHPTWVVMLFVTGYLVGATQETRTWLLIGLSAIVAYMAPMRPNQIGGVLAFFLLLVLVAARENPKAWLSQIGRAHV